MSLRRIAAFACGIGMLPSLFFFTHTATANTEVERLQQQIQQKNDRLSAIEEEIKAFEAALTEVGAEKNTLQKAINKLELERQKVRADINYTQNQIDSTDLEIDKLAIEIHGTQNSIGDSKAAVASIMRNIATIDDESMVEILLRKENISEFWTEIDALETVKANISDRTSELERLQTVLEGKLEENATAKNDLLALQRQYSDQQTILTENRNEQANLLEKTKNEEAEYQALLAAKKAAKDKLLAEVQDIESQIKFILDPNTIPAAGSNVFRWPIANPIITQYFGYTKFALSGAYSGNAHNGMDLGAPVGTKIYAPLTGTVRNVGNTDAVPGCYSWGKWVLIDHPNGLSTLYAHLSQQAVSPGQTIGTGDIVGYVGNTGYSTGPHLHFTVYVSDGVEVKQFNQYKSVTSCGAALSPFAAVEAYLDPLDYLPPI